MYFQRENKGGGRTEYVQSITFTQWQQVHIIFLNLFRPKNYSNATRCICVRWSFQYIWCWPVSLYGPEPCGWKMKVCIYLLDSHSLLVWFKSSLSRTKWQMENRRQPRWQAYSSSSWKQKQTKRTSWIPLRKMTHFSTIYIQQCIKQYNCT